MSSLVLELQTEALDGNVKVADLLRKALVVASKLNIREFEDWAKNELHGYKTDSIPDYRLVKGAIKAFNPYRGWIPVMFQDTNVAHLLSQKRISQAVGEIEDLVSIIISVRVLMSPSGNGRKSLAFRRSLQGRSSACSPS
jgi:hypothetical protein